MHKLFFSLIALLGAVVLSKKLQAEGESSLRLVSYNILDNSFINSERYPHIDVESLEWEKRRHILLKTIESLNADIICLQELNSESFEFFLNYLRKNGFDGAFAKKDASLQGIGTFFSTKKFKLLENRALLCDGTSRCGKMAVQPALVTMLKADDNLTYAVINTKIKWQPEFKNQKGDPAFNQISFLLQIVAKNPEYNWFIAGDMNMTPESPLFCHLKNEGFQDAYSKLDLPTCYAHSNVKRIDYIIYKSNLNVQPIPLIKIEKTQPLPTLSIPSDHVPIGVNISKSREFK